MSLPIQPTARDTRAAHLRSVKYDGSLNYQWPAQVLWEDSGAFFSQCA